MSNEQELAKQYLSELESARSAQRSEEQARRSAEGANLRAETAKRELLKLAPERGANHYLVEVCGEKSVVSVSAQGVVVMELQK